MQSLSPRNCLKISLAILISMGISCATPKIDTASESQALEHEGHHPAAVETQKRSDGSDMKSNDGMMAGGKMDAGMMDKMKMKQMMDQCMVNHKDNKTCDHQMMDKCTKNMDTQECMEMMSDAKKEGNSTKGKTNQ